MKHLFLLAMVLLSGCLASFGQETMDTNIHSVKLYKMGDQTSFPVIALNSNDALELDFDDLANDIKNYYYTFELRNADWSPGMLHSFEYIKGFQNARITTYRNSSIAFTRYTHYQAQVPDRNCYPTLSGNYLLKVFLNNDTSQLVFTRRMVVIDPQTTIAAQVQQPFNAALFNTHQKLQIGIQTTSSLRTAGPGDLHVSVLQNNNWKTALYLNSPTIYRGNYYEYSDEAFTSMPAGREFRWLDMRSLRLISDRMQRLDQRKDATDVIMKADPSRAGQPYVYYQDMNGSYTVDALESINPFWQGDYATVHFTYIPPGNRPFEGQDLYLFGEMTNYASDPSGKMEFNAEKGVYEKTLLLKQGYYNYEYVLLGSKENSYPDLSQTEGNYWPTENNYKVFVYYRPFGGRYDQVIGYGSVNSIFQRAGL